jgi:hypothetical protein
VGGGEQTYTAEANDSEFLQNILEPLIIKQMSFIAFKYLLMISYSSYFSRLKRNEADLNKKA